MKKIETVNNYRFNYELKDCFEEKMAFSKQFKNKFDLKNESYFLNLVDSFSLTKKNEGFLVRLKPREVESELPFVSIKSFREDSCHLEVCLVVDNFEVENMESIIDSKKEIIFDFISKEFQNLNLKKPVIKELYYPKKYLINQKEKENKIQKFKEICESKNISDIEKKLRLDYLKKLLENDEKNKIVCKFDFDISNVVSLEEIKSDIKRYRAEFF
tara:strand:- start:33292 stop:33936 length:645 start_codon:yes stop_codon:yes gene_type:complete